MGYYKRGESQQRPCYLIFSGSLPCIHIDNMISKQEIYFFGQTLKEIRLMISMCTTRTDTT